MTFSRLTLGDPRLRGKPSGGAVTEPCTEPVTNGTDIIPYGTFEGLIAGQGSGPNGNELPYIGFSGGTRKALWPSDASTVTGDTLGGDTSPVHWLQDQATVGAWLISTANPDTDTYHLRRSVATTPGGVGVYAMLVFDCDASPVNFGIRVNPGEVISISARASATTTSDGEYVQMRVSYFTQTSAAIQSNDLINHTLSTSYATYTHSSAVPANMYWARVLFYAGNTSGGTMTMDIDNVQIGLE